MTFYVLVAMSAVMFHFNMLYYVYCFLGKIMSFWAEHQTIRYTCHVPDATCCGCVDVATYCWYSTSFVLRLEFIFPVAIIAEKQISPDGFWKTFKYQKHAYNHAEANKTEFGIHSWPMIGQLPANMISHWLNPGLWSSLSCRNEYHENLHFPRLSGWSHGLLMTLVISS